MYYLLLFLLFASFVNADTISLETMQIEKRVAFVIGNGAYDESPMHNALGAAQKMKLFLEKHNFKVVYLEDASKRELIKGLREFNYLMGKECVALFYYNGHTVHVKNKNYIIPTETFIESDYHVLHEAIELDAIIAKMKSSQSRLNIIILDSAQKNPFAKRYRTEEKGLAAIKPHEKIDLIFSCAPNKIVAPYAFTTKLISVLTRRGTSNKEGFEQMHMHFKAPYPMTSTQSFYFNLPSTLASQEEKLWTKTLTLDSASAYSTYLSRYPESTYAAFAKANLGELMDKKEKIKEEQTQVKEDLSPEYISENLLQEK
ncbi:MAG: hypothetical protein IBX43_00945 [Campylobacterales bacterium]|nr:hypothetical protein [Campylobacterales bacterium]